MNILFVNEYHVNETQGGVQRVTSILSKYFIGLDFNITFVYFKSIRNEVPSIQHFKFPSELILTDKNKIFIKQICQKHNINLIINQMGFFKDIVKLIHLVFPEVPIISCFHSHPSFQLISARNEINWNNKRKLSKSGWIKLVFKPIYLNFLKNKISSNLLYVYKNSNSCVLLSDYFNQSFSNLSNLNDSSKLCVIENPLNPFFINFKSDISNKEKSILYVGRLNRDKRIDLLLNIWKLVYRHFSDWKFHIVGDGPEKSYLLSKTKELKLSNIFFHGESDKVHEFYLKSSIFVSTSAFEGMPMVLIESLSFGCIPVVYNTYDSVKDVLINDYNGFYISDLNQNQFVLSLCSLMGDYNKRLTMYSNCVISSKRFHIDQIGPKWIKLLQKINNE